MNRVRVGLIGLAWVFLLVAIATALLRVTEQRPENAIAAENSAQAPSDPLAELGVAPGNPALDDAAPANDTAR